MFFQGTLQEGIAAALSQAKLVLCFVTGEHILDMYLVQDLLTLLQTMEERAVFGKLSIYGTLL
jgi:hypothetical protein